MLAVTGMWGAAVAMAVSGCAKPTSAPSAESGKPVAQSTAAASANPAAAAPANLAEAPPPFSNADKKAAAGEASASAPAMVKRDSLVPERVVIPAGTLIAVRLQQSLSSQTASAGEKFQAVLDEPLVVNGQTVAEKGADVSGHVVSARQSGHLHHPGFLRIALDAINVNGKSVPVQSSSVYVQGTSFEKRNLAWIGGSTAGGALIGGLAGGGKGALIGSLIGAGGGTSAAYMTGHKDVGFAAERRLTFRLTQPVQVG
jgi:hypothetical protein